MLLQIPLDITDVAIEIMDTAARSGYVINLTRTLKCALCRECGKAIDKFYGYSKEITLQHLPILEKPVWIKLKLNVINALIAKTAPQRHKLAVGPIAKASKVKPSNNGCYVN